MFDPLEVLSDLILWGMCLLASLMIFWGASYLAYTITMSLFGK